MATNLVPDPSTLEDPAAVPQPGKDEDAKGENTTALPTPSNSEPVQEDDRNISTTKVEPKRRSQRIASGARADYNLKKRYRGRTQNRIGAASILPAKNSQESSVLLTDNTMRSSTEAPTGFGKPNSVADAGLQSGPAAAQQTQYRLSLTANGHAETSNDVLKATESSPSAITNYDTAQGSRVAIMSNASAIGDSIGTSAQNESRELHRAMQEYKLYKARNRVNELERAIELEDKFGVSFRD